ncbi:MAG: electron transport complex subunit RsxC [Halanaerobiales bacterium]
MKMSISETRETGHITEDIKRFKVGGINIPGEKFLANSQDIKRLPFPEKVVIPVQQHLGKPGDIIVKKGDYVQRGQCLVKAKEGISAGVHASISGEITDINEVPGAADSKIKAVTISKLNKGQDEIDFKKEMGKKDDEILPESVINIIKSAGIIGMGGAGFPTHIKLNPPPDKKIDTVIVNGAECEPYISIDDKTMRDKTELLFKGLKLIMGTVEVNRGIIACEVNKPEAIKKLKQEVKNWPNISLEILDSRYPHGAEKKLIEAVLNREVPEKGLPLDVGVIVNNVQTVIAITRAAYQGLPLIDRAITVSGRGVRNSANLIVPVGTSVKFILDYCGGINAGDYIPVLGGPMTGYKIINLEIPITKTNFGMVILTEEEYQDLESRVCIGCAKCVDTCPVYISPKRITDFINKARIEDAVKSGLNSCFECGACAYVCPSKRPLLKWLKKGKYMMKQKG